MADTGTTDTGIDAEVTAHVASLAGAARTASQRLALLARAPKDEVLRAMADDLDAATADIVRANDEDVERGRRSGLPEAVGDRLRLEEARFHGGARAPRGSGGRAVPG